MLTFATKHMLTLVTIEVVLGTFINMTSLTAVSSSDKFSSSTALANRSTGPQLLSLREFFPTCNSVSIWLICPFCGDLGEIKGSEVCWF